MNDQEIAEIVEYGKVLSHPIRLNVLSIVANEPTSTVMGYKRHRLGRLGVVSYHFNHLADLGCITIDDELTKRGTREHFYKATDRGLDVLRIAEEIIKSIPDEQSEEAPA